MGNRYPVVLSPGGFPQDNSGCWTPLEIAKLFSLVGRHRPESTRKTKGLPTDPVNKM
jgi:hypothetical protein